MALGLAGCSADKRSGSVALTAALGITIYRLIVSLDAVTSATEAPGRNLQNRAVYWVALPLVAAGGGLGLLRVARTD